MRIGIDLGTTNTVASYIDENGVWKLLEFQQCGSTDNPCFLPSCVAVCNGMVLVGQKAKDHGLQHPDEFVCDTKYDMGRTDRKYTIGGMTFTPVQAAEYILKEVYNELSRQFPGESSFNAFVTVPARFRTEARAATKEALRNSGFQTDDSCLTDEPIAAAVAYSTRLDSDKLILVVDIGGGTYDLSLLKTTIVGAANTSSRLEPVGWDGDLHLGGNDVDELLVKRMTASFVSAGGKDLYARQGSVFPTQEETRAAAMIRSMTLQLKKQLYAPGSEKASVFIPSLLDGKDLDFTITRGEYETGMGETAVKMTRCLENIFVGSGYSRGAVDHVLVVGGMAHEICLLRILEQMFGREKMIVPEDSMLLVSKGAAICNSNLRLHIENKAYTSIGLLSRSGMDVQPIIKEGETVQSGKMEPVFISPESADATGIEIKLVEFRGKFKPGEYTTVLSEVIQLSDSGKKSGGIIKKLLGKKQLPKLKMITEFTEDKLLRISVEQPDGRVTDLSLRLGGKN